MKDSANTIIEIMATLMVIGAISGIGTIVLRVLIGLELC